MCFFFFSIFFFCQIFIQHLQCIFMRSLCILWQPTYYVGSVGAFKQNKILRRCRCIYVCFLFFYAILPNTIDLKVRTSHQREYILYMCSSYACIWSNNTFFTWNIWIKNVYTTIKHSLARKKYYSPKLHRYWFLGGEVLFLRMLFLKISQVFALKINFIIIKKSKIISSYYILKVFTTKKNNNVNPLIIRKYLSTFGKVITQKFHF